MPADTEIEGTNLRTLNRAFQEIARQRRRLHQQELRIMLSDAGGYEVDGYALVHNSKIAPNVRKLLRQNTLINYPASGVAKSLGAAEFHDDGGFQVVERRASSLIMSCIADTMATRIGMDTLTTQPLDFLVNALGRFNYRSVRHPDTLLAYSVISFEVPQEIQYLDLKEYKKIRHAYADLREPFQQTMLQLSRLGRLQRIGGIEELEERIREITREFDEGVIEIRRSRLGKRLTWGLTGVGSVLTLASAAVPRLPLPWKVSLAAISATINLVQKAPVCQARESEYAPIQRRIASMRKDIFSASQVKRLIPV